MTAEIEHRSAPGLVPSQQPMARMILPRIKPFERVNLGQHRHSDLARLNNPLHPFDCGIEMAIVGNAQLYAVGAAGRNHSIAFGYVHGHRFFAQHMLSSFRRGDRLRRMQVNRRGDVDRFHLVIEQ